MLQAILLFLLFVPGQPGRLPDACKVVTLADVTAALGGGYAPGPTASHVATSELSGCLYRKDPITTVAVAILPAPGGDAAKAVAARRDGQGKFGRKVTPLAGVCDLAFTVAITPTNTTLIAAKGPYQVEIQVLAAGKPDPVAEEKLARAACARLP